MLKRVRKWKKRLLQNGYSDPVESGQQNQEMQAGPGVFASCERKQLQKDTEQRKTKIVVHASSVGRRGKGEGHQVPDTKGNRTSKNMKLCM